MRKVLSVIGVFTAVLYVIGAFVAGTFNSAQWDAFGKIMLCIFWACMAGATLGFHIWANPSQPHPGRHEPLVPPAAPRGKGGKVVQFRR